MKIRSEGTEFFHIHGQTDMAKLIVNFKKFANMPENGKAPTLCPETDLRETHTPLVDCLFRGILSVSFYLYGVE